MNKKPVKISTGIDAILNGSIVRSKHVLFFYTSHANTHAIQTSFFAMSNEDEQLLYITEWEPGLIVNDKLNHKVSVIHPENLSGLKDMCGRLRIIADRVSMHERLEEFLFENNNTTALCMYDLAGLEQDRIQKLVAGHDRLILYTPDMMLLSAGFLEDIADIADAAIERLVREYLDIIILALIAGKPMCGTDIIDIVHRNFNVLLSPGTIYPLLHRLKKEGLLECECNIKKKVYKPTKGSEANIQSILDEHLLANEFLNGFLKSTGIEANKI